MKYASSIRFGGTLLTADECDYEDYKRLGLLCPECKDAVFLRAEGVRFVKGKEVKICAHFCHFKSSDPAIASQCEARVNSYTKQELQKRANQSRNQRLRLLQKHFIRLLSFSILFGEVEADWDNSMQLAGASLVSNYGSKSRISFRSFFEKNANITPENLKFVLNREKHSELVRMAESDCPEKVSSVEKYSLQLVGVDRRMQELIIGEVIAFLSQKNNCLLLGFLILKTMITAEKMGRLKKYGYSSLSEAVEGYLSAKTEPAFVKEVYAAMNLHLCTVPWADAFAQLASKNS